MPAFKRMSLLKRLRRSTTCCSPFSSPHNTSLPAPALYTLPAVGRPKKTSTPVDQTLPRERYIVRDTPLSVPVTNVYTAPISGIKPPAKPLRTRRPGFLKKKSNPRSHVTKKTVVVPVTRDMEYLLPVSEGLGEPRTCDVGCIVCALAKPELRTRHHCTQYRSNIM